MFKRLMQRLAIWWAFWKAPRIEEDDCDDWFFDPYIGTWTNAPFGDSDAY